MIRLDDVSFAYPHGAFRLCIPELIIGDGARVAVVGPSGSGKTTLLNLVAGLALPENGRVSVGDTTVSELSEPARRDFRSRSIGFVFQNFALMDYLSARENILYPYRVVRSLHLDADVRRRAVCLAEACGIGGKLDRHPGALSQGEQQRVAICRALVTCPSLILADEATGNLDPETKTVILDLLFERAAEAGAALLAVTHDHELLTRFDRVIDFADLRQAASS